MVAFIHGDIISATWEAEVGRLQVRAQLEQLSENLSQNFKKGLWK